MFNFCRSIKKWVVTVVIWAQLQIPLSYATQQTLWFEVDRDTQTQLLHLKMYHSSTATDFDITARNLLADYALTFDHRDPYAHTLNDNFLFQGTSTSEFCTVSLSKNSDTKVDLVIYQNGRIVLKDLLGIYSDFDIKTYGDLTLDFDQAGSVHGLNLKGRIITQQSQLEVSHSFNVITTEGEQEGTDQFVNESQGQLFLPDTCDFKVTSFLNKGSIHTKNETIFTFHNTKINNYGQILNQCSSSSVSQDTNFRFEGFQNFNNQSLINSQACLTLKGDSLLNQGQITGDQKISIVVTDQFFQNKEDSFIQGKSLDIQANLINFNKGDVRASTSLNLKSRTHLYKTTGELIAKSLTTHTLGETILKGNVNVEQDATITSDQNLTLSFQEPADSTSEHPKAQVGGQINLTGQNIYVYQVLRTCGDININVHKVLRTNGFIETNKILKIINGQKQNEVKDVNFINTGTLKAKQEFSLVSPRFENTNQGKIFLPCQNSLDSSYIDNKGLIQTQGNTNINFHRNEMNNQGQIHHLEGSLTYQALGLFVNRKEIRSQGPLCLRGDNFSNLGQVTGDQKISIVVTDHFFQNKEDCFIQGKSLDIQANLINFNKGDVRASTSLNLKSRTHLYKTTGELIAKSLTTHALGETILKGNVNVEQDATITSDQNLTLSFQEPADSTSEHPKAQVGGQINLTGQNIYVYQVLRTCGDIHFKGASISNYGQIYGSKKVNFDTREFIYHKGTSALIKGQDIDMKSPRIQLVESNIEALNQFTFNASDLMYHIQGSLRAKEITGYGSKSIKLDNQLHVRDNLNLTSQEYIGLFLLDSEKSATGVSTPHIGDNLVLDAKKVIIQKFLKIGGLLKAKAQDFLNLSGIIIANKSIDLKSEQKIDFTEIDSHLHSHESLNLQCLHFIGRKGKISARHNIDFKTESATLDNEFSSQEGMVSFSGHSLANKGNIKGQKGIDVKLTKQMINCGQIITPLKIDVKTPCFCHDTGGFLQASDMTYKGECLTLRGETKFLKTLTADTDNLFYNNISDTANTLSSGQLTTLRLKNLNIDKPIKTAGGLVLSITGPPKGPWNILQDLNIGGDLTLNYPTACIQLGQDPGKPSRIHAKGQVKVTGQKIDVQNGGIAAKGNLSLISTHDIILGRHQVKKITEETTRTVPHKTLRYPIQTFTSNGSYLQAKESMTLQALNQFFSYGGAINADQNLNLKALRYYNFSGTLQSLQNMTITASYVKNEQFNASFSGYDLCPPFYMEIFCCSGIRGKINAGGDLTFCGVTSGLNYGSDIAAGGVLKGQDHIKSVQIRPYVASAITAQTLSKVKVHYHPDNAPKLDFGAKIFILNKAISNPPNLYDYKTLFLPEAIAKQHQRYQYSLTPLQKRIKEIFKSSKQAPPSCYYNYELHREQRILPTLSGGTVQYIKAPHIDFSQNNMQAGSFQACNFGTITVGRFTKPNQPKHTPFERQQFLVNFTQINQFYQENLTNRVAIYSPPLEWQEEIRTISTPVVINANGFRLDQTHARLFDVTLEAEGISNALRANGIATPVMYSGMTPLDIHNRFSANAQFFYRVTQGLTTPQDRLEINRIINLEKKARREFDQNQKKIMAPAPSASVSPLTLLLPKINPPLKTNVLQQIIKKPEYKSPYEITPPFGGPSILYDQPLLFHYISEYKGVDVLSAVLVFPRSWEEKTKNSRSLQGSVVTGNSNLKGGKLDIFSTYEVKERGNHTVDQTTVHAQVNVKTVTPPAQPSICWFQNDKSQPQSQRIFEVVQSGQLIGETVEFHGKSLHTEAGSKIFLNNAWFDTAQLLNQGVIRVKEYCFLDSREMINQRLQHFWDEIHTKTVEKEAWCGLSSSKKKVTETFHCAESYPLDVSGTFRVGNIYTQMMPQNLYPDRPQEGGPHLSKSHNQGGAMIAENHFSKHARDLISCSPNKDVRTQAYASKKSNWHSSISVSGAVGVIENRQAAYVSGGSLILRARETLLRAPIIRAVNTIKIHGDHRNEILATIDQQQLPLTVTQNKGQISLVKGTQEVATVAQIASERAGVEITTKKEGTALLQAPDLRSIGLYVGGIETVDGQVKRVENRGVALEAVNLNHHIESISTHATGLGKSITTTEGNKVISTQITLTPPSDLPLAFVSSQSAYTTENLEAEIRQIIAHNPLLPSHTAQGMPEASLIEDEVPGDGNCALHCLGLSRSEAIRLLKDHGQRDAAIRKLVRPDLNNHIQELAQRGTDFFATFPRLLAHKEALEANRHSKLLALSGLREQISARLIRENKGRILDHDMAIYLNHPHVTAAEKEELRRLNQEHNVAEQAVLIGFYESPEVYAAFIDTVYGRGEWFAYVPNATSALDALCQIKGINLVVKRKTASGVLKTVHHRHVNNQGPTRTLLHTMSGSKGGFYNPADPHGEHLNHFNRLLTPAEAQELVRARLIQREGVITPFEGPSLAQPGQAVVKAQKVLVQNLESSTPVDYQTKELIKQELLEESRTKTKSQGLSRADVQMVLGLAAGIATAGVGTAVASVVTPFTSSLMGLGVGGMAQALAARSIISVINNLDPSTVFKDVTSSKALKSYLKAGLQDVIIAPLPTGQALPLATYATHAIFKNSVNAVLITAIDGKKCSPGLQGFVLNSLADTIGTYGASRIGQAYGKGHLDGLTHKIAHGVVGAATGAILKGEKGILPGALGAISAEVIGDLFLLNASDLEQEVLEDAADRGILLDPSSDEYRTDLKDKINSKGNWAKMGAAVTALMLDQDVDVAIRTASTAVENNLIPLLLGLATLGSAAWTIYDVVDTYLEEGAEAAVEKLIIDGAITVATGGVAKLAGKGCAKLLPKETIHQLWTKYCTDNPLTAKLINKLSAKPLDHQTIKGVESDIIEKIHKNSHAHVGETHVYRIIDKEGKTYKIGESAQGVRKGDGASIRGEAQARKLQRETGDFYTSQIRETFETKKEAHAYQHELIKRFRKIYGENALPGNKSNY